MYGIYIIHCWLQYSLVAWRYCSHKLIHLNLELGVPKKEKKRGKGQASQVGWQAGRQAVVLLQLAWKKGVQRKKKSKSILSFSVLVRVEHFYTWVKKWNKKSTNLGLFLGSVPFLSSRQFLLFVKMRFVDFFASTFSRASDRDFFVHFRKNRSGTNKKNFFSFCEEIFLSDPITSR